jgi:hypothetical protein
MVAFQSGGPGNDDGAAAIRLRLGTLRANSSGGRVWDWTSIGPYEVICLSCGDDASLNYIEVPLEIRYIRGRHVTEEDARLALAEHIAFEHSWAT